MRALVFLPWAVPALVSAMGWRWLLDEQYGAINAWGLESGHLAPNRTLPVGLPARLDGESRRLVLGED